MPWLIGTVQVEPGLVTFQSAVVDDALVIVEVGGEIILRGIIATSGREREVLVRSFACDLFCPVGSFTQ